MYKDTNRKYRKYLSESADEIAFNGYSTYNKLKKIKEKTEEDQRLLDSIERRNPVLCEDSIMNNLCKYIESVKFDIRNILKKIESNDIHKHLMKKDVIENQSLYKRVAEGYIENKKILSNAGNINNIVSSADIQSDNAITNILNGSYDVFRTNMDKLNSNKYDIVDCLILYIYTEKSESDKNILWNVYGDIIYENMKLKNDNKVMIPFLNEDGEIEYLNKKFKLKELSL